MPAGIRAIAIGALTALIAGCGGTNVTAPSAPESQSTSSLTPDLEFFYNQELQWRNCGDADCAQIIVPVDYANPKGPTTKLAITKVKAKGEAIGSLFVNPGGPGGSAFDYAKAADYIVSSDVRNNYDVVGVDPRGVAKSSGIECLTDQQLDDILEADGTPDTPQEQQLVIELTAEIGESCKEKAGDLWHIWALSMRHAILTLRAP